VSELMQGLKYALLHCARAWLGKNTASARTLGRKARMRDAHHTIVRSARARVGGG
jgi:hypothetical protein